MESFFTYWSFDWIIFLFLIFICLFYLYMTGFQLQMRSLYFFAGLLIIIICSFSPLHFFGAYYLFSVHMLSHVLIILIASPLLVLGIQKENRFKNLFSSVSKRLAKYWAVCWFCGIAIMWFWHIPSIFNQHFSMHRVSVMRLTTFTLLIGGVLFYWPVIGPYKKYRLGSLRSVLYLSTACIFCSLLGLIITFSHVGTFTPYLNITDTYGFLPLIRNEWKISVAADQQMAGLIMWVPCCVIYLSASMIILLKWFHRRNEQTKIEEWGVSNYEV